MAQSAQIRKVNDFHMRFADWLIANPSSTLAEASKAFGYTVAWLSTIKNSDAFIDYFTEVSRAHTAAVCVTVRDKLLGASDQAISEIQERLEREGKVMPYATLLETVDVLGKRAGLGEGRQQSTNVQVNVGLVTKEELAEHKKQLRARSPDPKIIELKPIPDGA